MKVAVLTLTRDRLPFTQHCVTRLRELAGCEFDHYILDNGSLDGTVEWLRTIYRPTMLVEMRENVGVSRGINILLDGVMAGPNRPDVVVKFDNDCELTVNGTLLVAARLVTENPSWIVSPQILGLNQPPGISGEETVAGVRVGVIGIIGGIFMAAPASLYDSYRHNPDNPIWGLDDANLGAHWRDQGGRLGYLLDYPANHFLTTEGQAQADPVYYARKMAEFNA